MSAARTKVPFTLRVLLHDARARLGRARISFGHGFANARDEADLLVSHALGLPPGRLPWLLAREVSAAERRRALHLIETRIRRRIPAAYLTHEAWLGAHRFYVDRRVIVPRSFIAELLETCLEPWIARRRRIARALDLCTGSGCLAVLLAKCFPGARVDAADISRPALAVARRNVAAHRLRNRIRLIRSDVFSALAGRRYDLIVANPPYVSAAAMRRLPREYRHEPRLALAGGAHGLDIVRAIVRDAAAHLTERGLLVVEVGHHRRRVETAFPTLPLIWPSTRAGTDCVFMLERRDLAGPPQSSRRRARSAGAPFRLRRAPASGRA